MAETRFTPVTQADIAALATLVGAQKVLPAQALSEDYAHDELGGVARLPDVLVRVETTQDVAQTLRYANTRGIPVVVRGSGTGLVGAAVAVHGGIMLETTHMNRIVELDDRNLCVTVEPGVLLMELAAFCEARQFLYPPDPGEKSATIGGNLSTNAGGMRALKYGVTRDWVRGLEVVLPSGEVLTLGGKVVKNASGYDLKDLVIGSEGTLAVVTKAILRIVPLPAVSLSLLVPFTDIQTAMEAVPALIKSGEDLTALEFMERAAIEAAEAYLGKRFPDRRSPAYLLLTISGDSDRRADELYGRAAALCMACGASDVYRVDTPERKQAVWNARGAFLEAIKASTPAMDECDVVVPRTEVAGFIAFTHTLAARVGLRIPSFGHAGDGNLHIYLCQDGLSGGVFAQRMAQAFDALYTKAAELGGQVSGEHGVGHAKRGYLARQLGETQMALMRAIKQAFDPKGILNPDKVI